MKLTIGMPAYNNPDEVWFTVQALRMYQDLTDTEILIIDNFGCDHTKGFVEGWPGKDTVRYVRWLDAQGTAIAKNRVFAEAQGEFVFCIDSHVLLMAGAVDKLRTWCTANPECTDLLQGPIVWDNLVSNAGADSFSTIWSAGMWGQWNSLKPDRNNGIPYEIPMMGMGLFGCRKDAWLGFNEAFRGFGGEEGYIHEKYRAAGRKTLCLPFLQWVHRFRTPMNMPYTAFHDDKVRNYTIGFRELGLDLEPLYTHFGRENVMRYEGEVFPPWSNPKLK